MKVYIFDLDDTLFDSSGRKEYFDIRLFEGVKETLSSLNGHIILVTRGDKKMQNKKIEILGINSYIADIYICENDEEKLRIFENINTAHDGKDFMVIGNRIDCEIRYGKMLGFRTIHVNHGKYSTLTPRDEFEVPDIVIENFKEIKKHI